MSFALTSRLFDAFSLLQRIRERAFLVPRVGILVLIATSTALAQSKEQFDLTARDCTGSTHRVRLVLEVDGKLRMNPDGKKIVELPMKLVVDQEYSERWLGGRENGPDTLRWYHQADANMRIDRTAQQPALAHDRRIVAVKVDGTRPVIYSPLGPLCREELELLDIQGNSVCLSWLLPGKVVGIGESWAIESSSIGSLLGLEAVSQSDITAKLVAVENDVAIVDASGSVSGAVGGVASEIKWKAKLNFDVEQRLVTWVAMSIQEDRAIGHSEAGFKATARLRMAIGPEGEVDQLKDESLRGLLLEYDLSKQLLQFTSQVGGFRMLQDRRWRAMADETSLTILRMVDQGELIAQCNISNLPAFSTASKQLTLEAFQQDIKKSLGDRFVQFAEASESLSSQNLRVLRVVATGANSGLPILWTYYHLSDDNGRRLAVVFTMEERLVEQFAEADQILVNSIEFTALPKRVAESAVEASTASDRLTR